MSAQTALSKLIDATPAGEAKFYEGNLRTGESAKAKKTYTILGNGEIAMFSQKETFKLEGVFDIPDREGKAKHRVDFKLTGVEDYKTVDKLTELFCEDEEEKQKWLGPCTVLALSDHPKYAEFAYAELADGAVIETLEERGSLHKGLWNSRVYAFVEAKKVLEVYDKAWGKRVAELTVKGVYNVPAARGKREFRLDLNVEENEKESLRSVNFKVQSLFRAVPRPFQYALTEELLFAQTYDAKIDFLRSVCTAIGTEEAPGAPLALAEHPRAEVFQKQKDDAKAKGAKPEGIPNDILQIESDTTEGIDIEEVDSIFTKAIAPLGTAADAHNAILEEVVGFIDGYLGFKTAGSVSLSYVVMDIGRSIMRCDQIPKLALEDGKISITGISVDSLPELIRKGWDQVQPRATAHTRTPSTQTKRTTK